ncbi:hypothetical protein PIB30_067460 [Stylosanthes scabra]|uniref:Leucine-rich repeat extensin-like protein 3 n=1 Tax=Stylosanthes scabra TaxID=79078 RepID=A0ABU6RML2_9FABA|nr:hypothetical protein [Stylosanthes scabra]
MNRKVMADNLIFYVIIVLVASTLVSTTTVEKDLTTPCTMCVECENPCQPLPPPPPPAVVECPPPPSLPPPSPPPPSPPPPAAVDECPPPPPPQPTCPDNCGQAQGQPHPPPYPVGTYYFPGGTPFQGYAPPNYGNNNNNGERMVPFSAMVLPKPSSYDHFLFLVYAAFLYCVPYFLFI